MGTPLDVALALPVREGRVLVARRVEGQVLAGYWEFPGGKVDPGEEPVDAARRELCEETGLVAGELRRLSVFLHECPGRAIRFHVFLAHDPQGEVRTERPTEWAWKSRDELRQLRMPPANASVIESLARLQP